MFFRDMNNIDDSILNDVYNTIQTMERERKQALRAPFHAMYGDLVRRCSKYDGKTLRGALNILYKQRKIKIGRTINDRYISTQWE